MYFFLVETLMKPKEKIELIVDRIVRVVNPLRIILFGSAARGEANEHSDLDLLVIMPDGTHRRKTVQKLYRELYGVGIAKDIVVSNESDIHHYGHDPGYIYKEAIEKGIELYHV